MIKKISILITKKRMLGGILWICGLALIVASFANTVQVKGYYHGVSLRYNTPVSYRQAVEARRYAAKNKDDIGLWPTFWSESSEILAVEWAESQSACLWYSGDGALVWPARFTYGGYPAGLTKNAVCVSASLAWQLWGGGDVVGFKLQLAGEEYTVSGVFEHGEALVIANCGEEPPPNGWQAVELQGELDGEARKKAQEYADFSGLGKPDTIVVGPIMANIMQLAAGLPVVVLLLFSLLQLFLSLPHKGKIKREFFLFAVLLAFAFFLPWLLSFLPTNLVPNQWSDFTFWGRTLEVQAGYLREWLAINPRYVDVQVKIVLITQALVCAGLFLVCLLLCQRLGKANGKNDAVAQNGAEAAECKTKE